MDSNKLIDMDVDQTHNNTSNQTIITNGDNSSSANIINNNGCTLKRCSSAPMINDIIKMNTSSSLASTSPLSSSLSSPTSTNREPPTFGIFIPRARRFSASFSPHSTMIATSSGCQTTPRLTPRVNQLRQEEAVDVTNIREVAHEREIHNTMTMSQSWEDLTLMTTTIDKEQQRMLPLNISLPSSTITTCSSPSPTHNNTRSQQCFSPGIQHNMMMGWKSMSPSPTRKQSFTTRRSLSPTIAMRPSSLGPVKRKFDLDDELQYLCPPSKRIHSTIISTTTTIVAPIVTTTTNTSSSLSSISTRIISPLLLTSTGGPGPGGGGGSVSSSIAGTPESSLSNIDDSSGFTFHHHTNSSSSSSSTSSTSSSSSSTIILNHDEPMNDEDELLSSSSSLSNDKSKTTTSQIQLSQQTTKI